MRSEHLNDDFTLQSSCRKIEGVTDLREDFNELRDYGIATPKRPSIGLDRAPA